MNKKGGMANSKKLIYSAILLALLTGSVILLYDSLSKITGYVPAENNGNSQINGKIVLKDSNGAAVKSSFSLYDENGNEIKNSQMHDKIDAGKYRASITPGSGPVKKIEISGLDINSNKYSILYHDTPEDIKSPTKQWEEIYALDFSGMEFSAAVIGATAKGNSLFKCIEWDFKADSCNGRWKKVSDLIPGQNYNFTLTPGDPGIGELSNAVDLMNKDRELLNYNEQVTGSWIKITPRNADNFYTEISIKEKSSAAKELIIYETNNSKYQEIKIVDNSGLESQSLNITFPRKNARSMDVLECRETSLNDSCSGKWKKLSDISGEDYIIAKTTSGKSAYGISQDDLLLLDGNYEIIPNEQAVLRKSNQDADVKVQLSYMRPEKITTYYKKNSAGNEVFIYYEGSEEIYSVNFSNLQIDYAEIKSTATGRDLFRCDGWDFNSQKCNKKFRKIADLETGKEYMVVLNGTEAANSSVAFKENKNKISVLNENDFLHSYSEKVIKTNGDGSEDLEILLGEESGEVKKMTVIKHSPNSAKNDFKINFSTSEAGFLYSFSVNPEALEMERAELTVTASGRTLMKCSNWSFPNQTCNDEIWIKMLDITPGQNYTFNISSGDPGFGETSESSGADSVAHEGNSGGGSGGGSSSGRISDKLNAPSENKSGGEILSENNCEKTQSCSEWSDAASQCGTRTCTDSCGTSSEEERECKKTISSEERRLNWLSGRFALNILGNKKLWPAALAIVVVVLIIFLSRNLKKPEEKKHIRKK